MPKPMLGGHVHRDIAAWLAIGEGDDIDRIQEAIELIFTEGEIDAAKLLHIVAKNLRLRMKIHTSIQANDVEQAKQILLNEIKPALKSGK